MMALGKMIDALCTVGAFQQGWEGLIAENSSGTNIHQLAAMHSALHNAQCQPVPNSAFCSKVHCSNVQCTAQAEGQIHEGWSHSKVGTQRRCWWWMMMMMMTQKPASWLAGSIWGVMCQDFPTTETNPSRFPVDTLFWKLFRLFHIFWKTFTINPYVLVFSSQTFLENHHALSFYRSAGI